jgi:hypothetical protein
MIATGSFYVKVIKEAASTVYDRLQSTLAEVAKGRKDKPKIQLDINVLAPIVVINEMLFGEGLIYKDECAHIIFDFGLI